MSDIFRETTGYRLSALVVGWTKESENLYKLMVQADGEYLQGVLSKTAVSSARDKAVEIEFRDGNWHVIKEMPAEVLAVEKKKPVTTKTTKKYCPGCGTHTEYVPPTKSAPKQKAKLRFAELLEKAHVRCIHLPERIDREMIMLEAFRRLGIEDRTDLFFTAIDGTKQKNKPNKMRAGNWGCALSKSMIMLEAAARKKPLLLLEDDVVINPQIHEIMDACLAELPNDWKVLYLGCVALEPHDTMPTKGIPKREKKGQYYEVLSNPNLNHALLIRDVNCLLELSKMLADPETYKRDEGRFTSDYAVAQYFAQKGIPMYGVAPAVAKQCATYSDNEKKVVNRKAIFKPITIP